MPDNGLGELERLTAGEALLIDRRRRDESQLAAAGRLGVTHSMYGKFERDVVVSACPPKIKTLKVNERCLLYRRRVGKTQEAVAKGLKICRWWLNQQERGQVPCDELLWYWEN